MSRTRAERRHNTSVKAARRFNQVAKEYRCGATVSKNGEACACSLCTHEKYYSWCTPSLSEIKDKAWQKVADVETVAPFRHRGRDTGSGTCEVATSRLAKRTRKARRDAGIPEFAPTQAQVIAAGLGLPPFSA